MRWACSQRQAEVSLSRLRVPQSREPDSQCLSRSSSRGDSARLSRTQQSARSYTHIWRLSHDRVQLDQKKVAQLPPLRTTLLAPDPEDPTSTTLELDERMARLSSKKRTTAGFGLPCAARRVKWWLMRLGIGAKRRVNACGRPFQRAIVLVTASRLSGQRIRRSSLRSSIQQWAKRREKPLTWSAGITPCGNDSPVLSA